MLRKYMSDRGKIRSRRVTGNCAQHQRALAQAIKTARELVLLPYTQRTVTERPAWPAWWTAATGATGVTVRGDRGDRPSGGAAAPGRERRRAGDRDGDVVRRDRRADARTEAAMTEEVASIVGGPRRGRGGR